MTLRLVLSCLALVGAALGVASCQTSPTSAEIDIKAIHVEARYSGPDGGWDFTTFDPVHRRLYVSRSDGVTVLDVDTGHVTAQLVPGVRTHVALPINLGNEVLVTNGGSGGAFIANALTGAIRVGNIPTGSKPDGALLEPVTGLAWVLDNHDGGIALIDTDSGNVVGKIAIEGALESTAIDGHGKVFVTIEDKGEVIAIDARTRAVVAHIKMDECEEPGGLAFDPNSNRLVVACANRLAKIVNADTGVIEASLPIGPRPDVAIYDPGRKLVFVPTGGDGMMTAIDAAHLTIASVVATQTGARSGAVDPRTDRVYLPSGRFAPPATPGGRPTLMPGSFEILAVGSERKGH
jgi:DNA-binding beta-propeller fold protein YncE